MIIEDEKEMQHTNRTQSTTTGQNRIQRQHSLISYNQIHQQQNYIPSQDYTFSEQNKYIDIQIKALNLQRRLLELNNPHKYAIQSLTGNEYGIILIEQSIDIKSNNNRIIIQIDILQSLSALRGCMRIGIASKIKTSNNQFLFKSCQNHGCYMFSQDGIVLHDNDVKQNMKRIQIGDDFGDEQQKQSWFVEGDIIHLVYDGVNKVFHLENHTANTVHTLYNVDLNHDNNHLNNNKIIHPIKLSQNSLQTYNNNNNQQSQYQSHVSSYQNIQKYHNENEGDEQGQDGDIYSFISSPRTETNLNNNNYYNSQNKQNHHSHRNMNSQYERQITEEEQQNDDDEDDNNQNNNLYYNNNKYNINKNKNTYHFAIMMGIGPSKIVILNN